MWSLREIIARGSPLFATYNFAGIRVVVMDLPSSRGLI
jgi:hypothetical protein